MPSQRPTDPAPQEYDPLYLHSLRETLVIVVLFAVFCAWAISIYYTLGLRQTAEEPAQISTTLGMPTWVFLGIFVPWIAVDAAAVWFCFTFMKDDDLGEAHEGEDLAEQIEHMHERETHHE